MTALAEDRNTNRMNDDAINLDVAASVQIFKGSLVARDASGDATPGAVATTLRGVGRAAENVDNSSGSAGDLTVQIEKGIFQFGNSTSADLIDRGDIGADCYIVDDQTVALTDGTSTRSVAGKIHDVDSDGVWVKFD